MKTPLSYYGGKQQLAARIPGMIPEHNLYCEPFLGGAAVFFAKRPSRVEVINDTNGELINFYEVLKRDFNALEREVSISLHSRKQHDHAWIVYSHPELFDRIKRAWAIWMLANASYGCMLNGGFGYDKSTGGMSKKLANKKANFGEDYAIRLANAQIECCDALKVIRGRDTAESFFYCDPPYVGSDQGHYDGYSQDDFEALLSTLEAMQGKFLLSSFRNKSPADFTKRNGWHAVEIRMASPMTHGRNGNGRMKVEILTANYPIAAPK